MKCVFRAVNLYTILINKEKRGSAGSIIAIIKGTDVKTVISILLKLSRRKRFQVREITLDMAPNMEQIARICFPAARRVTDRFHVQKLAYEAVQDMRVMDRITACLCRYPVQGVSGYKERAQYKILGD